MDKDEIKSLMLNADSNFLELWENYEGIYHPFQYKRAVGDYKTHLYVNYSPKNSESYWYEIYSLKRKSCNDALAIMADAIDLANVTTLREAISFVDNETGDLCYDTWESVTLCQDIVGRDRVSWLTIWYEILITDTVETYSVGVKEKYELSLLQHALDQKKSTVCLIPSSSCIQEWDRENKTIIASQEKEFKRHTEAYMNLLNDAYKGDLLKLCQILPSLPFGSGLMRIVKEWVGRGRLTDDLELEAWILKSHSKQIFNFCKVNCPQNIPCLGEYFSALLNPDEKTNIKPATAGWPTPKYRRYKNNKKVIAEELAWFKNNTKS